MCTYCGAKPDTRDHVPSKIFLDEPFPENLPVVPCCNKCNQSFSLDEEYVACFIECIICGSTDVDKIEREKVKRILANKESLRKKILDSMTEINGKLFFKIERKRLENVLVKLAKGHAKFENSEPILEHPTYINFKLLSLMTQEEINLFYAGNILTILPEVGSRAMQNIVTIKNNVYSQWILVQEDTYKYSVTINLDGLSVRFILSNYIAAEVGWVNLI